MNTNDKINLKMYRIIIIVVAVAAALGGGFFLIAQQDQPVVPALQENISYTIGYIFGRSLRDNGVDLNFEELTNGLEAALNGKSARFNEKLMSDYYQQYTRLAEDMRLKKHTTKSTMNNDTSREFLAKNKNNAGVKETESGLQYMVLTRGKGPSPDETDTVSVHYRGTLIDGTEFDSSYSRNQPASFPLNRVIAGWTEGLQLMNVGSKFKFFIPPHLAYGDVPPPGSVIEPNSLLIFEVELLSVEGKQ